MSLLLDALKKAAEAKSRGETDSVAGAEGETPHAANTPAPEPAPPPPVVERAGAPSSARPSAQAAFDDTHSDTMGQRFSQYDEFDETQQLEGDFDDRTGGYGTPRHAETVFTSKTVQRPLRGRIPFFKMLGCLLLILGCAAGSYYYVQERDYEFQRQLSNIRNLAPIVPIKLPEEEALEAISRAKDETIEALPETVLNDGGQVPTLSDESSAQGGDSGDLVEAAGNVASEVAGKSSSNAAATLDETSGGISSSSAETVSAEAGTVAGELGAQPVETLTGDPDVSVADADGEDRGEVEETDGDPTLSAQESQEKPAEPTGATATADVGEASATGQTLAADGAVEQEPEPEKSAGSLSITRASRELEADVHVREAYAAYQAGQFDEAEALYERALQLNSRHRDALLGRAAVHLQRQQSREAIAIYQHLLSANPRDHAALAGLNSLAQSDNLQRYESDLRFLLKETPQSAPLNYALGVLLSRQQRWADAQQHFFTSFTGDSENPDIAFNLAVSLDNLGKSAPAAQYYRVALELAKQRAGSFDRVQVYRRLQALEQ